MGTALSLVVTVGQEGVANLSGSSHGSYGGTWSVLEAVLGYGGGFDGVCGAWLGILAEGGCREGIPHGEPLKSTLVDAVRW